MSSSKSRLSPASNGMMKRGQILMKVLRESGRPLKEYVIVFLLDNRGIDNCINRNTRVLRRFATKAGSGSRKSSRSCQPCLVAQMSIVRHRDLSCPLKLKPRNSDTSNTKPTHRTLNGLSPANTTVFMKKTAAAAAIRRASVGDGGMTKIDCII